MRKLLLGLPIAAVLLAVGVLLSEAGGTFASSEPAVNAPHTTNATTPKAEMTGDGWQETAKGNKS